VLDSKADVLYVCSEATRDMSSKYQKMKVLPMHASLPAGHQLKVFQKTPHDTRKVVLATNIAEASITINGIVYGESVFKQDKSGIGYFYALFNTATEYSLTLCLVSLVLKLEYPIILPLYYSGVLFKQFFGVCLWKIISTF